MKKYFKRSSTSADVSKRGVSAEAWAVESLVRRVVDKMNLHGKLREVDLESEDPIPELRVVEGVPPREAVVPVPTDAAVHHQPPAAPESDEGGTRNPPPNSSTPSAFNPQPLAFAAAPPPLTDSPLTNSQPSTINHQPDWAFLFRLTEYFAVAEIDGYCWREVSEGVLPSGYDASSIAAEAVEEVFREVEANSLAPNPQKLKRRLRRCVRKIVNRLHHRMENEVMVSECDLHPIFKDYGEVIGPLEMFPAQEPDPSEVLMAKEDAAEFEQFKTRVHQFLGKEHLLRQVFACHCAEISMPKAIARKLKVPVRAIQKLQKRLERRIREFLALKASGKSKI